MQFFLTALVVIAAASCTYGRHVACPAIWAPVCGSDGITYASKCFLEAQGGVTLVHNGKCNTLSKRDVDDDDCPAYSKQGICTMEYNPVCASNGKTYPNKCGMCVDMYKQNTVLRVVHFGTCASESNACPAIWAPVCGSDGNTYASKCFLEAQGGVTLVHNGKCNTISKRDADDDDCPAYSKQGICTMEYFPVCASNGKTYPNKCGMCVDMYKQNTVLRVVHLGKCVSESDATLYDAEFCRPQWKTGVCTREYNPICGSDGKTYGNPCEFCYYMYKKQANGNDMRVRREGECQDEDKLECPENTTDACTLEYAPICGSDGRVYSNKCFFCHEKQEKLKQGIELYFDHRGMCYI